VHWLNLIIPPKLVKPTHLQPVGLLLGLDPLVGLALWVYHEWPAAAGGHHDGILDGERVIGQPCQQPVPDRDRIAQDCWEGELGAVGQVLWNKQAQAQAELEQHW
jgi:hypothetical protein